MKYLLPCSCGKSVAIEVSQAGQSVRCTCGNMVDVPTMRLIRQLPPAAASAAKKRLRDRSWSLTQRLLFSGGLAILVGGLLTAGVFQMGRSGLKTTETTWDNLERAHQDIDSMTITQTWDLWTMARNDTIGPYNPPPFILHRLWSATWLRAVVGGMAAAVVGLVLMVSAFVIRPRAKPRGRPKATTT
jgi:hypothetical protein